MTPFNKKNKVIKILNQKDFKKPTIATIIAVRLKSTRLPKKAILKIGNLSSIELCIKNSLKFKNVDYTILATSTIDEDTVLKDYTYSDSVIFHRGDPEDVIQRYLDIIDKLKIDVFIRVTGDMPYISDDILQILLKEHFKSGADYTTANKAAVGTNLEIINTSALKKVKKFFPNADYSEYMTFYFKNNPDYFKLNYINLPSSLIRNCRLTLDYKEDLDMFNKIESYFKEKNIEFNIHELFNYLDNNPDIAKINQHISLKYESDKKLIELLNKVTTITK